MCDKGSGTNDALVDHLKKCCGLGQRPTEFICDEPKSANNNNDCCAPAASKNNCAPAPVQDNCCAPKANCSTGAAAAPAINFCIPAPPPMEVKCQLPETKKFDCACGPTPPPLCLPPVENNCSGSGYAPPNSCPCPPPPPPPKKCEIKCNTPETAKFECPCSPPPPVGCAESKKDNCAKPAEKKC